MLSKLNKWVFLTLVIFSCDNRKPESPFDFPANGKPVFNLSGEKTFMPKLLDPYKVKTKGDFLIVIEKQSIPLDKPLIHLIDPENLSYIRAKGVIGFGPNEITDSHLFHPGFSDSTFWSNSTISKRMAEFSLYDTSRLSINEFRQPESMYAAINVQLTPAGTFLCLMAADSNRLVEFDADGRRIAGYGTWEPVPNRADLSNFMLSTYNKGWFRADHETGLFVKANLYRDRIEIFDYKTKKFTIVDGPRLDLPTFQIAGSGTETKVLFSRDQKYGHRDIAFGNQYIYDLYGGFSSNEIRQTGKIAETVYVLTKTGKVVGKLNLDRSITSLAVNESLGKLYGITTDEEPGIVVYDIPDQLIGLR